MNGRGVFHGGGYLPSSWEVYTASIVMCDDDADEWDDSRWLSSRRYSREQEYNLAERWFARNDGRKPRSKR